MNSMRVRNFLELTALFFFFFVWSSFGVQEASNDPRKIQAGVVEEFRKVPIFKKMIAAKGQQDAFDIVMKKGAVVASIVAREDELIEIATWKFSIFQKTGPDTCFEYLNDRWANSPPDKLSVHDQAYISKYYLKFAERYYSDFKTRAKVAKTPVGTSFKEYIESLQKLHLELGPNELATIDKNPLRIQGLNEKSSWCRAYLKMMKASIDNSRVSSYKFLRYFLFGAN